MTKLRIGVVGLGGIAQKAWLPVLTQAGDWTFQGAFSPTQAKAQKVCDAYRIPYVSSIPELAAQCDAVFVHSATSSHFAVVSELLQAGVNVCVDKPLAENLADAERLVEMAVGVKHNCKAARCRPTTRGKCCLLNIIFPPVICKSPPVCIAAREASASGYRR